MDALVLHVHTRGDNWHRESDCAFPALVQKAQAIECAYPAGTRRRGCHRAKVSSLPSWSLKSVEPRPLKAFTRFTVAGFKTCALCSIAGQTKVILRVADVCVRAFAGAWLH